MGCGILYDDKGNHRGFMCGKSIIPCHICGRPSDFLCDYPIGDGKTCDLPLCDHHANTVGNDIDFCPVHHAKFKSKESVDFKQDIIKISTRE